MTFVFERLAEVAAKTQIVALGEPFLITDKDGKGGYTISGIYDRTLAESYDTQTPVYLERPNVMFRLLDTKGEKLDRQRTILTRKETETVYCIVDLILDRMATVRYILEEM